MRIDEINLAIIKHLRDGRKSYKVIADELGVTENTIRSRVNKMRQEGALDIVGMLDPEIDSRHRIALIGVKLNNMELVKRGEAFSNLKGVVCVAVVTGRFDLIVTVLLKDGFGLLEFYTDEMSRIEGVRSVETFVVYKSFNLKVPYVL